MKIKLFDGTELQAQVKEEIGALALTMNFNKMNDWFKIGEVLVNSNLCKVVVTYDDDTYSEYINMKFVEANMVRVSNVYIVTVTLAQKTEFEMKVDELVKSMNTNTDDLTKTQVAITEIYELIMPLLKD